MRFVETTKGAVRFDHKPKSAVILDVMLLCLCDRAPVVEQGDKAPVLGAGDNRALAKVLQGLASQCRLDLESACPAEQRWIYTLVSITHAVASAIRF